MKVLLEKNAMLDGELFNAGSSVDVLSLDEVTAGYAAFEAVHLQSFTLTKNALIAGAIVRAGEVIQSTSVVVEQGYKDYEKQQIRLKIADSAGDTLSLLGTTSDAVQLLILMECVRASALATANDFESFKAIQSGLLDKLLGQPNSLGLIEDFCDKFIADVFDKKTVLPYTVKYQANQIGSIFDDVAKRATATSQTFLS